MISYKIRNQIREKKFTSSMKNRAYNRPMKESLLINVVKNQQKRDWAKFQIYQKLKRQHLTGTSYDEIVGAKVIDIASEWPKLTVVNLS